MRFVFHPEARVEFLEAIQYYNDREEGLGLRFTSQVRLSVDRILEAPLRWPILEGEVRRSLIPVFPYGILYSIREEVIVIIAVMSCHRKPGYWRQRFPQSLS